MVQFTYMSGLYRTPVRSTVTRAGAMGMKPVISPVKVAEKTPPVQSISLEEVFKQIGELKTLTEEIKKIHTEALPVLEEVKGLATEVGTIQEFVHKHEQTQEHVRGLVESIDTFKLREGKPGKDAVVDIHDIAKRAAALIPAPVIPTIDENKIVKRVAKLIPKPKDGDPGKHADVGAVIQVLREGGHLRAENIVVGETTLDKHLRIMDEVARRNGVRGGGDTVAQGSGILITTNANGQKVITATGSGGFTPITVTGVINDSNKTFASVTLPTLLNINGAFYLPTGGAITWTWIAGTITLSTAVGTGGSIFGI